MLFAVVALAPLSLVGVFTPVLPLAPSVTSIGQALPVAPLVTRVTPGGATMAAKKVVKKPTAGLFFETQADLQTLAIEQNTALGFWDPIGLSEQNFWNQGESATIGFLRHAEIKHGRVAMAAFVGYCVQANGIFWPWPISGGPLAELFGGEGAATVYFSEIGAAGTPGDQWDAVPAVAKAQILITIAIFELIGETPQKGGMPHYMRGGKPGYFPPLKSASNVPHPVPFNLYDPFDLFTDMDEETKSRRLNMEINNGRLAMLGIFSFLSASKGLIVPGLNGLPAFQTKYAGEYMAFFSPTDGSLPFVDAMYDIYQKSGLADLAP
jgi:hypothetical protein